MTEFSVRYGLPPYERFAPEAAEKLVGTHTVVTRHGARVGATILGATVEDDGAAMTLTLSTDEPLPVGDQRERCDRKVSFPDEQSAKNELAQIIKLNMTGARRRDTHVETGYYPCPRGDHFHLTSEPWSGRVDGRGARRPRRRRRR